MPTSLSMSLFVRQEESPKRCINLARTGTSTQSEGITSVSFGEGSIEYSTASCSADNSRVNAGLTQPKPCVSEPSAL